MKTEATNLKNYFILLQEIESSYIFQLVIAGQGIQNRLYRLSYMHCKLNDCIQIPFSTLHNNFYFIGSMHFVK